MSVATRADGPLARPAWGDGPYSTRRHGITLTTCDSEPVRTPGCVQPHGVLVVFRPDDRTVAQVSDNLQPLLGVAPAAWLGRSLADLVGPAHDALVARLLADEPLERNPTYAFTWRAGGDGPSFDAMVHTVEGVGLLELEITDRDGAPAPDFVALVRRTVVRLQAADTVRAYCDALVDEIHRITGLDRVIVYRFLPDDSGEVFAERARADLPSWLGQRYPADDIPKPAREIYRRLWLRPVPDAAAGLAEMTPLAHPDTGRPLEMTHCALRGASLMYTEYLRNMGVAASLTMPIQRDGQLWGLVTCHHLTPTRFPWPMRAACEFVAQVASLNFRAAEDREHTAWRGRLQSVEQDLLDRAAGPGGLPSLTQGAPTLADLFDCGGAALHLEGRWLTVGRVPPEPVLHALADWLREQPAMADAERPVFATSTLGAAWPPAAPHADVASGLLAVPLARAWRSCLVWFRPESVHTVRWGGDPRDKSTVPGPDGPRLAPRSSFEPWVETVHGQSRPWSQPEIDAAVRLRRRVTDVVVERAEQLALLNAELTRSNEELDAFAHVASHDLKEPLRGIHRQAQMLLDEAGGQPQDERSRERAQVLLRLAARMDGLLDSLLHFSRVGRLQLEQVDEPVGDIVREALEMLGSRLDDGGADVQVLGPLPTVPCDRIRVREVFANLVSNALKYGDRPARQVRIGALTPAQARERLGDALPRAAGGQPVFFVRDDGIGIDPRHHEQVFGMFRRLHARDAFGGGAGAGLAIVRKLVAQHGGTIWIDSAVGAGATFYFTLAPAA